MNPILRQELRRAESAVQRALADIARARTLGELSRARHVALPSLVRSIRYTIPGYRSVSEEAESRADALFSQGLAAVQAAHQKGLASEVLLEMLGLLEREWRAVSGEFPRASGRAFRELALQRQQIVRGAL